MQQAIYLEWCAQIEKALDASGLTHSEDSLRVGRVHAARMRTGIIVTLAPEDRRRLETIVVWTARPEKVLAAV